MLKIKSGIILLEECFSQTLGFINEATDKHFFKYYQYNSHFPGANFKPQMYCHPK